MHVSPDPLLAPDSSLAQLGFKPAPGKDSEVL